MSGRRLKSSPTSYSNLPKMLPNHCIYHHVPLEVTLRALAAFSGFLGAYWSLLGFLVGYLDIYIYIYIYIYMNKQILKKYLFRYIHIYIYSNKIHYIRSFFCVIQHLGIVSSKKLVETLSLPSITPLRCVAQISIV